ncbi:MAG TPA: aminotransferase class III-fold pyridoxal phosphate-dependent enzyme [Conexibacter sp.]|nr:aminotransferase class III-fold pyridoxal phosphate-dependent enzyme [Conexibacter sp.]
MSTLDRTALLLESERARLHDATAGSRRRFARVAPLIPAGVASDFQGRSPHPIYLTKGHGPHVWDVDGRQYVDLHAGAGAALAGHGNPQVGCELADAATSGTCLAAASVHAEPVARELAARFGLRHWRFVNSGSEATMAALRVARAFTGRDLVVKLEGSYNGHHDAVLVSISAGSLGGAGEARHPVAAGVPDATARLTLLAPYNDLEALTAILGAHEEQVACVVLEVPLLTPTAIAPRPGYLEGLHDLTLRHGALLVFDEVKTGVAVHPGGARGLYGVTPDVVALGKSFAGGVACGALGASGEVAALLADGRAHVYGTFNGNPLTMRAALVTLRDVLTPGRHEELAALARRLCAHVERIATEHDVPLAASAFGAKGALRLTRAPIEDAGAWVAAHPPELVELVWTFLANRGVFLSPAPDLRWTVTVAHRSSDIDHVADVLAELATAWAGATTT